MLIQLHAFGEPLDYCEEVRRSHNKLARHYRFQMNDRCCHPAAAAHTAHGRGTVYRIIRECSNSTV